MYFIHLKNGIINIHETLKQRVFKSVNSVLTIRNWLIGFYIVEFQQNGKDRAQYGDNLLEKLASVIKIKGLTAPELSRCRQFYQVYPRILGTASQELKKLMITQKSLDISINKIFGTATQDFQNQSESYQNIGMLFSISYSHFVELIKITDDMKRKYYELLIVKTHSSVKELKRQIATLSYERIGLSKDKEIAFEQIKQKIVPERTGDIVKSHYIFEFLGINHPGLIEESELEQALINHLHSFLLELGYGFCFEARQKRILIGDEYFFIDLVFYHRVLKCHVLIELKVDSFSHSYTSQLVTYLNYYKKNIVEKDDNPPVGILLITDKNTALVEYATANDKDRVFVSRYHLQLPTEKELKEFIERELTQTSRYQEDIRGSS